MLSRVTVAKDLSLVVGEEIVPLTPSEGFRLAERLIRRSTARMVAETIADAEAKPSLDSRAGARKEPSND
jgi:hypothetical protein